MSGSGPIDSPASDGTVTVAQLKARIAAFVAERGWERYHNPASLAASISIEAAELLEHFQWAAAGEGGSALENPTSRAAISDELADVVIYCLSFAHHTGIDLARAVLSKVERNETRFPPGARPRSA